MLKSLLVFILFSCSFSMAYADPWDCMTMEEAQALAKWLKKNPYISDYCDCCHNEGEEKVFLLYVSATKIIPCEYEENAYSVELTVVPIAESVVGLDGTIKSSKAADYKSPTYQLVTLNYHFTTVDNVNLRLFEAMAWMEKYESIDCHGLQGYPTTVAADYDKKYKKWLVKRANGA